MVKVKGSIKAKVKRTNKPVKAGSEMPKNIGGAVNAKLVATVKKVKSDG